jgi:hypothetical protein
MKIKLFSINETRIKYSDKTDLEGMNPPSFFVGSKTYPKVNISPMISLDLSNTIIDEPDYWKTNYSIPEIIKFRTHLIRAQGRRVDARAVEELHDRILTTSQELVLSENAVNASLTLEKPLHYDISFSQFRQPIGPTGKIKSLILEETPKIDHKVEYITSDTDLLAQNGIKNLFKNNLSVTRINRILSAGLLGKKSQRRLVPTRWSITATDDQIGKELIQRIKDYTEINEIKVFECFYLDNHFLTILIPNDFSFEFTEAWFDSSEKKYFMGTDFETSQGRKSYASNTAGGYYAARLAVLEYLERIKKQARVYCWREVGSDYFVPLGVWQVRENLRNGLNNTTPIIFDETRDAFLYVGSKFKIPLKKWLHKSSLLRYNRKQMSLKSFLHNN